MSVNLSTGDVLEVKHIFSLETNKAFNVLHYRVRDVVFTATGLPPATQVAFAPLAPDIAAGLWNNYYNSWRTVGSTQVLMEGTTVQNVEPKPRSLLFTFTPNLANAEGNVVGDPLPLQDCATLVKRSDFGERWGMGRIYVAGLCEIQQDAGFLDPVVMANLTQMGLDIAQEQVIIAGPYTIRLQMCLLGVLGNAPRITLVRTCQPHDNVIKTQRRRRPGKGI